MDETESLITHQVHEKLRYEHSHGERHNGADSSLGTPITLSWMWESFAVTCWYSTAVEAREVGNGLPLELEQYHALQAV